MKDSTHATKSLVSRLWSEYIAAYKKHIVYAFLLMAVSAGSTAGLAKLMEPVIDEVFKSENMDALKWVSVVVFFLFVFKGAATYGESIVMNFIGQRIIANIQIALFRHLTTSDLSYFHDRSTGSLISHCTNDVTLMKGVVSNTLTSFGKDFLTVIFLVSVMFYQDTFLALITFFVFPVAILPIVRIGKRMRKVTKKTQSETGSFLGLLGQIFQSVRLIQSYNREEYEIQRAQTRVEKLLQLNLKSNKIRSLSSPIMETLGGMAIVVIISYGGMQVIQHENTAGAFFSFISALLLSYEPMKRLARLNANIQEGLAAASRIFSVLDHAPSITNGKEAHPLVIQGGEIYFDAIKFSYESGYEVIRDFSLRVRSGSKVALVGPSGAGKSTLLNLLPRFYEVSSGSIRIDGQDIRHVTLESLRDNIALVSQEVSLFDDTVYENIAYGRKDATHDEIIAAARAAQAHVFIENLPNGYDTIIGESGLRLSGGQRQRISIARALLKNAPILLLDEATSSLDPESEFYIQKALKTLMKNRTSIVIAHRLSTVRDADRICVIESGRIAEEGTHTSLMEKQGVYAQLSRLQFSE